MTTPRPSVDERVKELETLLREARREFQWGGSEKARAFAARIDAALSGAPLREGTGQEAPEARGPVGPPLEAGTLVGECGGHMGLHPKRETCPAWRPVARRWSPPEPDPAPAAASAGEGALREAAKAFVAAYEKGLLDEHSRDGKAIGLGYTPLYTAFMNLRAALAPAQRETEKEK